MFKINVVDIGPNKGCDREPVVEQTSRVKNSIKDIIETYHGRLLNEALMLDGEMDDSNYVITSANNLLRMANSMYRSLKSKLITVIEDISDEDAEISGDIVAEVSQDGDVLKIHINELLPKRNKQIYDSSHEVMGEFEEAVRKALKQCNYQYEEPVVVMYVFFYDKVSITMVDDDNYITKPLTDVIAVSCLRDDSPKWKSLFMEYGIGSPHTEIHIIPKKEFSEYYRKFLEVRENESCS